MKTAYLAVIHKDADSDFGVSFPDVPGCISAGANLDEALANAGEALMAHFEESLAHGEALPDPSGTVKAEDVDPEGFVMITAVEIERPARSVRVNITMDETLLQTADRDAERRGMSRSAYLAAGARLMINNPAADG